MRGLEFSLWRIRDLLSTRAYLTITEALAAILLIAPGFCGSLCKFAWVTCDRWLRWEILAIQTIKIRSEIRERERGGWGGGRDHWLRGWNIFHPLGRYLSSSRSQLFRLFRCTFYIWWCWMMLIQALTLAHLSHGPPAPGASWQSWSQESGPGFSTNELFSQGYLGSSALQTPETFVTCHTMSRRRHRGCWQETRTLISWWRNSDNVWR